MLGFIKEDRGILGVTVAQASRTAQDRSNWRTALKELPMHLKHCGGINDDGDGGGGGSVFCQWVVAVCLEELYI